MCSAAAAAAVWIDGYGGSLVSLLMWFWFLGVDYECLRFFIFLFEGWVVIEIVLNMNVYFGLYINSNHIIIWISALQYLEYYL